MARPRKELDQTTFEGLCRIQCTLEEIASVLGCSEDTVERWCKRTYQRSFADVLAEKKAAGRASLRRTQLRLAEKNPTMAIFLGKQYLGQKDVEKHEHSGNEGGPLEIVVRHIKPDGAQND